MTSKNAVYTGLIALAVVIAVQKFGGKAASYRVGS